MIVLIMFQDRKVVIVLFMFQGNKFVAALFASLKMRTEVVIVLLICFSVGKLSLFYCLQCRKRLFKFYPPKGGRRFMMSPPCVESQGCQFDRIFLYPLFYSSA